MSFAYYVIEKDLITTYNQNKRMQKQKQNICFD